MPSFHILAAKILTYLNVILQKYRNLFLILSGHTIQHVCDTLYSAETQFCDTRYKAISDSSIFFIENYCTSKAHYLEK